MKRNLLTSLLPSNHVFTILKNTNIYNFFKSFESTIENYFKYINKIILDSFLNRTTNWQQLQNQHGLLIDKHRKEQLESVYQNRENLNTETLNKILKLYGFDGLYAHNAYLPNQKHDGHEINWWNPNNLNLSGFLVNPDKNTYEGRIALGSFTHLSNTTHLGDKSGWIIENRVYHLPQNKKYFPYFIYIAGKSMPNRGAVKQERFEELKTLLYKICPTHLWIGLLLEYRDPTFIIHQNNPVLHKLDRVVKY